jgi:hypothetical protein
MASIVDQGPVSGPFVNTTSSNRACTVAIA